MADIGKDYTGKVIRVQHTQWQREYSHTGIVLEQEQRNNLVRFHMLLLTGEEWRSPYNNEIRKISSVRLDENIRKALHSYFVTRKEQKAFLAKVEKEKLVLNQKIEAARKMVKDISPEMSHTDFLYAAEALFSKKFPSAGGYDSRRYFSGYSIGDHEVTLHHIQEIEKYATPERYSFLGRRYDGTLSIHSDSHDFKRFCERNAPSVLSVLAGKCKTSTDAQVGDKDFLTVYRSYTIPLAHGVSKDSLRQLEDLINGREVVTNRKPSLAQQIQSAQNKTPGRRQSKESEKER